MRGREREREGERKLPLHRPRIKRERIVLLGDRKKDRLRLSAPPPFLLSLPSSSSSFPSYICSKMLKAISGARWPDCCPSLLMNELSPVGFIQFRSDVESSFISMDLTSDVMCTVHMLCVSNPVLLPWLVPMRGN